MTWKEIHGRYTGTWKGAALNIRPRSDIRPTTDILIIRMHDGEREPINVRWGMIPGAWPDPQAMKKYLNHNARSDKILSLRGWWNKPFEGRRCLIPASGYYEWKEDPENPKKKQRFYFTRRDGEPLTFAGMWDHHAGQDITSATMITTEPNKYVAEYHDRMPAILAEKDWDAWLAEPRFDLLRRRRLRTSSLSRYEAT